jgi:tetratricopeptide (TPR) repeat protein
MVRRTSNVRNAVKIALFAAGVALALTAAHADSSIRDKCEGTAAQGITPDMVIATCTDLIRDGESSAVVATAYYNRGNAHFDKKEWALAIDDYTHALYLRPKYPTAMFNRGLAKKHAGDIAGGDADMAASKTLN